MSIFKVLSIGVVTALFASGGARADDDLWRPRPNEAYGPETYCNWNRTGLPAAQQSVCLRRDEKAAADQKHASATLLDFEANNAKAIEILAQAHAAGQCGLRSDGWVNTFDTAFTIAQNEDVKRFNLTAAEIAAANLEGEKVFTRTIAQMKCGDLLNSPTMDKLDQIRRKLIGGYH